MAQPKRLRDALDRNLAGYPVVTTGPVLPENPGDAQATALAVVLVDQTGAPTTAGSVTAVATVAAPTYVEGSSDPLSMDLGGALRVTGTISASTAATATAAAPTYVEGTSDPLSQTLAGSLRVTNTTALPAGTAIIGKVGIDQTTPGTTNLVALAANQSVNLTQIAGTAASVNNGTVDAGTQRVAIASNNTPFPIKIDQTTPGTTNAVSATNFPTTVSTGTGAQGASSPRVTVATDTATVAGSATLPAGTNIIGKVGIDQTTPGTTNLVRVSGAAGGLADGTDVTQGAIADAAVTNPASSGSVIALLKGLITKLAAPMQSTGGTVGLVAGSAIVGKIGIDQTTPGTTNLVALAANQSVNNAQINGVTPLMGNGASGTGAQRVTIASDSTGTLNVRNVSAVGYETVAASATAQVLGGAGATGDFLVGLLVIPATTSPGVVTLLDNATSISVFAGGASSVSNLVPFMIPIGANSASGAWKVTTGTNVSVIGIGNFT